MSGEVLTTKQIAERLGMSPAKVEQIERQALRKLRALAMESAVLRDSRR